MARDFYPFVEKDQGGGGSDPECEVTHPARIAVYDDAAAAPRVVVVEPKDVREYLEEVTATVNRLSHEQGGNIPFMVIREIVENFIHAYFQAPTITILDGGNTIRFSDQGPGIREKDLALEYGTSSATEPMKQYIRGVGSGLPYAQQYMEDKGGSLQIEDNISGGTVVTISTLPADDAYAVSGGGGAQAMPVAQPYHTQQPQYLAAGQYIPQPQYASAPQYMPQPQYAPAPQPYQQGWGYGQGSFSPAVAPQPAQPVPAPAQIPHIQLNERQQMVMSYLGQHEDCGPTDLVGAFPQAASSATWSRTLNTLKSMGLVTKLSQKYQLTELGRGLLPRATN